MSATTDHISQALLIMQHTILSEVRVASSFHAFIGI